MSHDLQVTVKRHMRIGSLRSSARQALEELLGSRMLPPLYISRWSSDSPHPVADSEVMRRRVMYLAALCGSDDIETDLMCIPYISPSPFTLITVRGAWPVKFALAAALAVALSRQQDVDITDCQEWLPVETATPSQFLECFQPDRSFTDLEEAAEAFNQRREAICDAYSRYR